MKKVFHITIISSRKNIISGNLTLALPTMQFVPVHSCTEAETGDSFLWAPRAKLTPDYHRVEGKSFKLVCRAHQDYFQCLNGACVKIVGVQSRSHSHTPQNSTGLCCSDPTWALADMQRAKMKVRIFHSLGDGYVIISRPMSSPPALRQASQSCWRFRMKRKA